MTQIFRSICLASHDILVHYLTMPFLDHYNSLCEPYYQECSSRECPNNKGCACCFYESCRNIYFLPGMIRAFDTVPSPCHEWSRVARKCPYHLDDLSQFHTKRHSLSYLSYWSISDTLRERFFERKQETNYLYSRCNQRIERAQFWGFREAARGISWRYSDQSWDLRCGP